MRKRGLVTILVVLAVIILSILILTRSHPHITEEVAKCIGQNSILYTQYGCHACETQEKTFGDYYEHLNVIDCFFEQEKCINKIRATPTWEINGELHVGAKTIEKLKELTGCE